MNIFFVFIENYCEIGFVKTKVKPSLKLSTFRIWKFETSWKVKTAHEDPIDLPFDPIVIRVDFS